MSCRPGGRRPRRRGGARLPVDRMESRQSRLPSLGARLLRGGDAARSLGRQPGRADRLLHRAGRRPRAQGRRRIRRQRPLAVLLRRRQLGLEHAGSHRLRRRRQDRHRLAPLPRAEDRLPHHRHVVRDRHGRNRQQGHRGDGAVRSGTARACPARLPRRQRASGPRPIRALYRNPLVAAAAIALGCRTRNAEGHTQVRGSMAPCGCTNRRESRRFQAVRQARPGPLPDRLGPAPDRESASPPYPRNERSADLATKLRIAPHAFAVAQSRRPGDAVSATAQVDLQRGHVGSFRACTVACQHFSFNSTSAGSAFGVAGWRNYVNPSM